MTYSSSGSKTSRSRLETSLRRRKKSKCNSSNVTELRKADKRVSKQKEIIKNLVEDIPSAVRSIFRDDMMSEVFEKISEHKIAEEALRLERDIVQKYINAAGVMIMVIGADRKVKLINKKGCKILGYNEDEIVGKDWVENFLPKHIHEQIKVVEEKLKAGDISDIEHLKSPVLTKSGEERIISWHNALLWDDEGKPSAILSTGEDITEQKLLEEGYRNLVDNSIQGLAIIQDGHVVFFNKAFCLITGYDEQELLGLSAQMLIHPDDREIVWSRHQDRLADKPVPARYEFRSVRKDGSTAWFEIHASKVEYQGHPATQAAYIDITERKKAEEQLQSIFNLSIDIVSIADINTNTFTKINPAFKSTLGFTDEELLSRPFIEFIHPEDVDKTLLVVREKLQKGHKLINFENRYRCKNGSYRWLNWVSHPVPEQGLTYAVAHDITERKKAEELIREQNKFLNNILASMSHPFIVIDADNYNVKVANAVAKRAMLSEKTTCYMFSHKLEKPCDDSGYICPLREIKKTGRSVTVEHTHYDNNGNPRYIELHSHPVFDDRGNITDVIEYFIDITRRKQAEERAEQHKAEFLHVSRLSTIGEMVSGIAHELNQPLCAAINYTNACLRSIRSDNTDTDELIDNMEAVARQSERVGKMINSIKNFAKKRVPNQITVNINDVVRALPDLVTSEINRNKIRLNLELEEQAPMVLADLIQIEQVLLNLVLNSIESMVHLETNQRQLIIRTRSLDGTVQVDVCDKGQGISDSISEQIFEPFFTTKPDGLGIGLSVSRSIIEAHKGDFWASNNSDGGATFTFTLPAIEMTD